MTDAISPRQHQYVGYWLIVQQNSVRLLTCSWSGRQHYWASEPVPEKYAFQATNQQMEGHCRRVKPPRRGLYNREPYNHVNAGPW